MPANASLGKLREIRVSVDVARSAENGRARNIGGKTKAVLILHGWCFYTHQSLHTSQDLQPPRSRLSVPFPRRDRLLVLLKKELPLIGRLRGSRTSISCAAVHRHRSLVRAEKANFNPAI